MLPPPSGYKPNTALKMQTFNITLKYIILPLSHTSHFNIKDEGNVLSDYIVIYL